MSDKPVIGEANPTSVGPPKVLAPNGEVAVRKNRCIAHQCGKPIDAPAQMCAEHWANVPFHLREALTGELAWMAKNQRPLDVASKSMLDTVVRREVIARAEKDPAFAAELERQLSAKEPLIQPAQGPRLIRPS